MHLIKCPHCYDMIEVIDCEEDVRAIFEKIQNSMATVEITTFKLREEKDKNKKRYDDFRRNDAVIVSDDNVEWHNRYFDKLDRDGNPMVYNDGTDSWTNSGKGSCSWLYCVKAGVEHPTYD